MSTPNAIRGRVLTFTGDPAEVGAAASHRYLADGVVVVEDGMVTAAGEAAALLATLPPESRSTTTPTSSSCRA